MDSYNSMQRNRNDYYNPHVIEGSLRGVPQKYHYDEEQRSRPGHIEAFLHFAKTGRLITALVFDGRVSLWRKAFFFGAIGGLLLLLLFPDLLNEAIMSTVLPLAGSVLGIPLDAGFDWLAFALAIATLFRFFPPELVAEHYRRIFR